MLSIIRTNVKHLTPLVNPQTQCGSLNNPESPSNPGTSKTISPQQPPWSWSGLDSCFRGGRTAAAVVLFPAPVRLLLFSPAPTPSAVQSPCRRQTADLYFLLPPSPPLSPSRLPSPWTTICRHRLVQDVDRLLIYVTHTHTHTHIHAQQSLHQVWLIWLVTRVSRAITSIQMFHSPFVCTPYNTHTHTYTHIHTNTHLHTHTHLLSSPPLASSRGGCDAACGVLLFWLFLLRLSELSVSCDYLLCIRRKEVRFIASTTRGQLSEGRDNTGAHIQTHTHTFPFNVIATHCTLTRSSTAMSLWRTTLTSRKWDISRSIRLQSPQSSPREGEALTGDPTSALHPWTCSHHRDNLPALIQHLLLLPPAKNGARVWATGATGARENKKWGSGEGEHEEIQRTREGMTDCSRRERRSERR